MNKKSYIMKFVLLLSSIVLSFIFIEIFWRVIIFSDFEIFKKQRQPELYADEYADDDYWKLRFQINKKELLPIFNKAIQIHNKDKEERYLGRYIFKDYKHTNAEYLNDRRPVLLYGDSFAACYSRDDCFDHILNNDKTFSANHYLLNYGMGGYGLDQIYLMLKNSIDHYNRPFVVLSFMTLDLDRSVLTFREGPKPFFIIKNNSLELHEKSDYPNAETLFSDNKPQIVSYFYRRVVYSGVARRLMPNQLISYLKREDYFREKIKQINEKIILEIINELKSRNVDFIFLIFHPSWIRESGLLDEDITDWRDVFIKQVLHEHKIPYIWSKDIIFQQIKEKNLLLSEFFVGNGHPSAYQREILAKKIKKFVLNNESTSH